MSHFVRFEEAVRLEDMDDIDRKLIALVIANPRMHFREIAKRLGISRQAAHHRMRMLTKAGVVQGTVADISYSYFDAVPVVIFGRSNAALIEETLDRLGQSELTRRVVLCGGNYLYVVGLLRKMSELDTYAEYVRRAAEMPDPTVGIYSLDPGLMPDYIVDGMGKRKPCIKTLAPLDLKIIASLKEDARRPVADIAAAVGASTKTVRRHLERMISEGSLEIGVHVDTSIVGDMMFLAHVKIRGIADKGEVGRRLLSQCPFQDAYIRTFSNLPGFLVWVFWTDKLTEMRKALSKIGEDEDVLAVMPNIAYLERMYATWRDRSPAVKTRPSTKSGIHRPHSKVRTQ